MTFVSYAQNFEDLMLWRALKDIENGFYIDVGAQDPVVDSVTKAFYLTGWRGINIEPSDQYYQRLVADRPEDVNIKVVVRSKRGEAVLHEFADTGMSTTSDEIADLHQSNGWEVSTDSVIPTTTLARICQDQNVEEIHFLKIDVEGDEKEVLEGFSFSSLRPWIVVVEATAPNSNTDISDVWQPYLEERDYQCVYFDGLNKFFVAKEHKELIPAFALPPNVIDGFVQASHALQVEELRKSVDELSLSSHHNWLEAEQLKLELASVYNSRSWRLTSPLRFVLSSIAKLTTDK